MAVHKLIIDDFDSADYTLIAIHSSLEDYRLAYFVNRQLEIKLERCPKDIGVKQKGDLAFFSRYTFEDPYQDSAWNLIRNKDSVAITQTNTASLFAGQDYSMSTSVYFIPELKTADYVLKIDNAEQAEAEIVQNLLMVKHIATAYKVDHYKLKSKNNLIFLRECRQTKKTKIVATLGPACSTKEVIKDMIDAGVNVFRINFSHADYADVQERIDIIRGLNAEFGYNTSILADLQGPKLRVGVMKEDVVVNPGDIITFQTAEDIPGTAERVYMNYKQFPNDVNPGERILLDDGKLMFQVIETNKKDEVKTVVVQGGPLKSKKGVNLPNTKVSLPALTEKDIRDAIFAIKAEVDWIALSFVRTPRDLEDLQDLIAEHSSYKIPIVAKIEKPEGVENIDKIVAFCDALMVARGDLGVEMPAHEVPLIQKKLIQKAKAARIPVIVATQMMETMITSLTPTRAEVNDVANSVMDGADAVMLSGETSVGNYPVQVIEKMTQIIEAVEDSPLITVPQNVPTVRTKRYITKSICYHAAQMANTIKAQAISTLTNSGYTAFQISAWRPNAQILVFTDNKRILTQMSLLWGVNSFYYDKSLSTDETVDDVNAIAQEKGYVTKGDILINLAAMPVNERGMVNTLRVSEIE